MSEVFFSVIIPTFNRAKFISSAIESVVNQVFTDFELIIIDDGSTDNTKDIVTYYNNDKLKYYFQENKERSAARNKGIELSTGKYICFLDSDDEWALEHLNGIYNYLENSNFPEGVFYTGMYRYDKRKGAYITKENRKNLKRRSPLLATSTKIYLPNSKQNIYDLILSYSILPSTICCSKQSLKKHLFNIDISLWEDSELWLRMAAEYKFHQVPQHSVIINYHEGSTIYELEEGFSLDTAEEEINYKLELLNNAKIKKYLPADSINKLLFRSYYNHFYHAVQKDKKELMKHFLKKCLSLKSFKRMRRGYLRMYMDMYRS